MKLIRFLQVASAAFFFAGSALAQTSGTVTNHAIAVGKGAGTTGFTSVTCADKLFLSGVSGLDPACRALVGADLPFPGVSSLGGVKSLAAASNQFLTGLGTDGALTRAQPAFSNLAGSATCAQLPALTGDVTTSAGACATAIGSGKVLSAMLGADVYSTAHSWSGQQTFVAPVLGTPASGTLTNATGLPISTGVSGLGTGVAAFLATPSSANLATAVTGETGSGALVFGTSPNITTPTGIVKGDVGLGNVDNTSDATKNAATATLTNKAISGGTADALTSLGIRTTGTGAFDVKLATSGNLTANRTLSVDLHDANRALDLSGGITIGAGGFATTGGSAVVLNTTALSTATLPAGTQTLVGQSSTDTLTNKTISGASNTITNVPVTALNSGTGASSSTFWRGDGTWSTPAGGGGSGDVVGPSSATDNALARYDSTTGKLIQDSQVTLGDTDGKLSRSAGISVQGTNTNDNAAAGYVGEFVSSTVLVGSAISLTSTVQANVTSISLTAGDWQVYGNVVFGAGATTVVTQAISGINTTSATLPTAPGNGAYGFWVGNVTGVGPGVVTGQTRLSLSTTTTVYLVAYGNFTTSTLSAYGFLGARRVR